MNTLAPAAPRAARGVVAHDATIGAAIGAAISAAIATARGTAPYAMRDPRAVWLPARGAAAMQALLATGSDRLLLADGRCARLRAVRPDDAEAEQSFVMALSVTSRRSRFHGAVKQLPAAVLAQMTAVDFEQHVAIVAEAGCDDGGARLVADARYIRSETAGTETTRADDGSAEFALAVADDWQGLGLGSALLQRLMAHARASGLGQLHGRILVGNSPMLALVRRMGARLRNDPYDATIVQAILTL
jgi:acetyltransferase